MVKHGLAHIMRGIVDYDFEALVLQGLDELFGQGEELLLLSQHLGVHFDHGDLLDFGVLVHHVLHQFQVSTAQHQDMLHLLVSTHDLFQHFVDVDVFPFLCHEYLVVAGQDAAHPLALEDTDVLVFALDPVDEFDVFEYLAALFVVVEQVLVDLTSVDQNGGCAVCPAQSATEKTLRRLHPLLRVLPAMVEVDGTRVALRPGVD